MLLCLITYSIIMKNKRSRKSPACPIKSFSYIYVLFANTAYWYWQRYLSCRLPVSFSGLLLPCRFPDVQMGCCRPCSLCMAVSMISCWRAASWAWQRWGIQQLHHVCSVNHGMLQHVPSSSCHTLLKPKPVPQWTNTRSMKYVLATGVNGKLC